MKINRTIICIDVGFRHMGVAIWSIARKRFVQTYVISTSVGNFKYVSQSNRVAIETLSNRLGAIIRTWKPNLLLAEMPTGASRNAKAASCMSMAFATVISLSEIYEIPLEMIRPDEIKKLVGLRSRKAVPKELVQQYVIKRFGGELLPDNAKREHVADAMACLAAWMKTA